MAAIHSSLPFAFTRRLTSCGWPLVSLGQAFILVVALFALRDLDAFAQAREQRGFEHRSQAAEAELSNGNYYALIIGIDEYRPPMEKLKTAVNDAKAVGKTLNERFGFRVEYLLDQDATRFKILDALSKYRNTLNEDDNLLIYYAGHGFLDRDAKKAYWLPVDAESGSSPNRIIADELTTGVRVLPSRHVLIISDSCYSGGLTRDADAPAQGAGQQAFIRRMLRYRSRTLMASGGDEPVSDDGKDGHSVFAYALLRALERTDGTMFTAGDLFYSSIQKQVAGGSGQLPEYSIVRDSSHEDGDFVFTRAALPTAVVPDAKAAVENLRSSAAEGLRTPSVSPNPVNQPASSIPPELNAATLTARAESMIQAGNYADALPLLRAAAEQSNASAQVSLGLMYEAGEGVAEDDAEAVRWYRVAADQGDATAQNNLGWMFQNGKGVAEDDAEAVKMYRAAAVQGNAAAQNNLGVMYAKGNGVAEDNAEAVEWYRKSANQGDAHGQVNLGRTYYQGNGVAKDYQEAARWYRKAADQGNPWGQSYLGTMYANGQGVTRDLGIALYWYSKAAAQGNAEAQDASQRLKAQGVAAHAP